VPEQEHTGAWVLEQELGRGAQTPWLALQLVFLQNWLLLQPLLDEQTFLVVVVTLVVVGRAVVVWTGQAPTLRMLRPAEAAAQGFAKVWPLQAQTGLDSVVQTRGCTAQTPVSDEQVCLWQ
jgi:hypothetical protein